MSDNAAITPLRGALLLGLAGLLAAGLLAGLHEATRERIAMRGRQQALEHLSAVLPRARYDNDPIADTATLTDPRLGPGPHAIRRARRQGVPTAMAIEATSTDGYAGPIRLIVGIDLDGAIIGVRVLRHNETPGLGDPIEARRSRWIHGFDGRRIDDPSVERWTVKPDGGDFDAFTGATITPRAVIRAVRRTLEFHQSERDRLYALPPDGSARPSQEP